MGKKIVNFKSLDEEMEFWDTHDATEFEAKEVTVEEILDELRHHSKNTQVMLSLETELLNQLKTLAARRGVSYSSLMRELLWQGVKAASVMSDRTEKLGYSNSSLGIRETESNEICYS